MNRFRDLITKKNYLFGEDELPKEKLSVLERWNLFYRQYRNEFPQITKLATSILSLPISTAAVEREIKNVKSVKSETRSSLFESTLEFVLIAKDLLQEDLIKDRSFVNLIYKKYAERIQFGRRENDNTKSGHKNKGKIKNRCYL